MRLDKHVTGKLFGRTNQVLAIFTLVASSVFTMTSSSAMAEISSMGEAINIAGRQRMLSQRIAQSYFLKGLKPESERGDTQLQRAVIEFDRNLEDLKHYTPADSIRPGILSVESEWDSYKTLALSEATKDHAEKLLVQSDIILQKTHFYVTQLEKLSGTSKGEIINLSGRQRMLSQRIAKNFLALHWGIQSKNATGLLYEDLAEYENVLSYLAESDINTPEISTQLSKVQGQFKYASKGFDGAMSLSQQRLIHVVTGTTDAMLQGMNVVTNQYASLLTD